MKHLSLFLFFITFLTGLNAQVHEAVMSSSLVTAGTSSDNFFHAMWDTVYYPNRTVNPEWKYGSNEPYYTLKPTFADGEWKIYYDEAKRQKMMEFTVRNGLQQGYFIFWDKNGTKRLQYYYIDDGYADSSMYVWYASGKLKMLIEARRLYVERNRKKTFYWWENGDLAHVEEKTNDLPPYSTLDSALTDIMHANSFSLEGKKLKSLPADLARLQYLLHLNLAGNKLRELPGWLENLRYLRSLNLGNNDLDSLPSFLLRMTNLKFLNCGRNNFGENDPVLQQLKRRGVQVAFIAAMDYYRFPDRSEKQDFHAIYAGRFIGCDDLRKLGYPTYTDYLNSFPNLITLYFTNYGDTCKGRYICDSIRREEVTLPGHCEIDFSRLSRVEHIYFKGNDYDYDFHTLPSSIYRMPNLRSLHISHSIISELPKDIRLLKKLEVLDLTPYRPVYYPAADDFRNKYIDLYSPGSGFGSLPEEVGELGNLRVLIMTGSSIKELPRSMGRLEKLEVLDLTQCLQLDPEQAIEVILSIPNLHTLYFLTRDYQNGRDSRTKSYFTEEQKARLRAKVKHCYL
jgi:Leucine-rich repeat (LRR) protein